MVFGTGKCFWCKNVLNHPIFQQYLTKNVEGMKGICNWVTLSQPTAAMHAFPWPFAWENCVTKDTENRPIQTHA